MMTKMHSLDLESQAGIHFLSQKYQDFRTTYSRVIDMYITTKE